MTAKNEVGSAETSCRVTIQEAPLLSVDSSLVDQQLVVSEQWKVPFAVTGYPEPKITWRKNNEVFTSDKHVRTYAIDTSATIAIYSVEREDTATYTITAENQAGTAEKVIKLAVVGTLSLLFLTQLPK